MKLSGRNVRVTGAIGQARADAAKIGAVAGCHAVIAEGMAEFIWGSLVKINKAQAGA